MVGNARVWDLRKLKDIVFQEGIQRIGNHWFYCTAVEIITVPASVREIGVDAFCYCRQLKSVTFAKDSQLEKLGAGCFASSALEKVAIPRSVNELQDGVFDECGSLTEVVFEENSSLKRMGGGVFSICSSLRHINLPEGLE